MLSLVSNFRVEQVRDGPHTHGWRTNHAHSVLERLLINIEKKKEEKKRKRNKRTEENGVYVEPFENENRSTTNHRISRRIIGD